MQNMPESFFSYISHPYVLVPVKSASPIAFCVICVYNFDVFCSDLFIELSECFCDPIFSTHFITCSKRVTGIKTDTYPLRFIQPFNNPMDMLKTAADTVLLSCGIFKEQHHAIVRSN